MRYDLAAIRELVSAAFSDEELRTLCFDHYRAVYEQFAAGQSKGDRVLALVAHADTHGLLDNLLAQVRTANPHQYEVFERRLQAQLPDLKARGPAPIAAWNTSTCRTPATTSAARRWWRS